MYYVIRSKGQYLYAMFGKTAVWGDKEFAMRYARDHAIEKAIALDGVAEPFIRRQRIGEIKKGK